MDRIFISATAQHAGKTTTALGLYKLFEKLGKSVNYIKPVGQRSLTYQGHVVDEDAVLFKENLKCQTPIEAMTAVTVPKGFTEQYIFNRNKAQIYDDIDKAIMGLDEKTDITIIEGTGHAGVGSVFDASNATVACLLGAKAVIIAGGGIGKCLDQIALNQALFLQENVEIMGVVINKVLPDKYAKISRVVGQGLKNMGLTCLGVIPYEPKLTFPTVEQLINDCKFELLAGSELQQQRHIRHNLVAALPPDKLQAQLTEETLLIIPGGCVATLFKDHIATLDNARDGEISALLFADGGKPSDDELEQLNAMNIPVLFSPKDTFTISAKLGSLIVKISPRDNLKVDNACQLMEKYLDMEAIQRSMLK
jgi:uncharacterized protein